MGWESTVPAGAAKIYGIEPEVQLAVPVGRLQLHINASILSDKYTDFKNCTINTPLAFPPGGTSAAVGSCTGNHLTNAPEQEGTVGFNYSLPVMTGTLALGADLYHSGTVFYGADNTQKQGGYNTVSAEVSYAFAGDRARLRVYGRNLTNKAVASYGTQAFLGSFGFYKPPRAGGIELQYRWP